MGTGCICLSNIFIVLILVNEIKSFKKDKAKITQTSPWHRPWLLRVCSLASLPPFKILTCSQLYTNAASLSHPVFPPTIPRAGMPRDQNLSALTFRSLLLCLII